MAPNCFSRGTNRFKSFSSLEEAEQAWSSYKNAHGATTNKKYSNEASSSNLKNLKQHFDPHPLPQPPLGWLKRK
jgi:viroplasmin and RNaseH domain-containing protein